MTSRTHPLMRSDTMFGVCAGLGEELGISPTLLRVAFAVGLFFSPLASIAAYAAGGAVVYLAWLLVREPKTAEEAIEPAATVETPEAAPAEAEPLPIAA